MLNNIIEMDAHRVRDYIARALDGFLNDPPVTVYQQGFLAALCVVYKEACGKTKDARLEACEHLVSSQVL